LSHHRLTPREIRFLQEVPSADYKIVNIRLREGEYQYDLAEAIASFQLELFFPDVKDIAKRLYGEEKTNDTRFIRKIQTILKKMQKSNVVRIMKKEKPWELQRYALSSFKFQDVDKNLIILATDQQIEQMQGLLHALSSQLEKPRAISNLKSKIFVLVLVIVASYAAILWDLMQLALNPIIFVSAFSIAVACSLMLGKILSQG
jgi:phage-related holin